MLNVLRGEMSLVGPRPLPVRDFELLEPWHRKRYLVLPGMTGLWQIAGRSSARLRRSRAARLLLPRALVDLAGHLDLAQDDPRRPRAPRRLLAPPRLPSLSVRGLRSCGCSTRCRGRKGWGSRSWSTTAEAAPRSTRRAAREGVRVVDTGREPRLRGGFESRRTGGSGKRPRLPEPGHGGRAGRDRPARAHARGSVDRDCDGPAPPARRAREAERVGRRRPRDRDRLGGRLRRARGLGERGRRRAFCQRHCHGDPGRDVPRPWRLRRGALHVPRGPRARLARAPGGLPGRRRSRSRRVPRLRVRPATHARATSSSGTGSSSASPRTRDDSCCCSRRCCVATELGMVGLAVKERWFRDKVAGLGVAGPERQARSPAAPFDPEPAARARPRSRRAS